MRHRQILLPKQTAWRYDGPGWWLSEPRNADSSVVAANCPPDTDSSRSDPRPALPLTDLLSLPRPPLNTPFANASANIATNLRLRTSQRRAHQALVDLAATPDSEPYLPVGCGKSGCIAFRTASAERQECKPSRRPGQLLLCLRSQHRRARPGGARATAGGGAVAEFSSSIVWRAIAAAPGRSSRGFHKVP